MTKKEIINFLRANKEYLRKKFYVKKIGLFGSFARDEATEESDIDIVVDMPPSFDNFFALKYFLEEKLKRRVDLGRESQLRLYIKEKIKNEIIYA